MPDKAMRKGSREWFEHIIAQLGEHLVGIEVSHYSKEHDVIPRCQVTFVLKEFYMDRLPQPVLSLRNVEGFRMFYHMNRGEAGKKRVALRTTVLFDFRDDEECPRETMLQVTHELGFTVAPELLNNEKHTARLSPSI